MTHIQIKNAADAPTALAEIAATATKQAERLRALIPIAPQTDTDMTCAEWVAHAHNGHPLDDLARELEAIAKSVALTISFLRIYCDDYPLHEVA